MRVIDLLVAELATPTGQSGPLSGAYGRAASAVWHSVLGAAFYAAFGLDGLPNALLLAVAYWVLKESGDLRRGGAFWDGAEDALMVAFGAWYGVWWWPLALCGAGAAIMASAAVRERS